MKETNDKILSIVYSDENKFLLLKTNPKHMKTDMWYVVTGGVKEKESFEEAVKREVKEETGLEILKIIPTEISFDYEWPKESGILKHEKMFITKVKHGEPKITRWEHLDWNWLSKDEFIKKIDWYSDKNLLKEILDKIK
jgi:NADH pyrophosphatase NudC (nudix superfamily)